MKMRVLITGGTGYVGGRIAQFLAGSRDIEVVLGSRRGAQSAHWAPGARVIGMDWLSPGSLLAACDGADAVVHCAGMNEVDCARDPVGALEVNGVYSVRLIEAAKARGVRRIVYLSTAHVYGATLCGRIDETTSPRPRHPYATSHRAAEDVLLAAHDERKLTGIVLRLSNGFGTPARADVKRWTLLVNDLCRQAVSERRMVLLSSGLQRRDFVTLHDAARAVSHLLELPADRVGNGIFNMGGGRSLRVLDIAELVQARCSVVLGYAPEIARPPQSGGSGEDLDYRIDKLLKTGFSLTGDAAEEIDGTVDLCRHAFGSQR